jgi:hypothetical protein
MNRNISAAMGIVVVIAFGFAFLGTQPAAQGQKPDQHPRWEYKIYKPTDGDFATNIAETEFNKLAADGWIFVETIVSRVPQPPNQAAPPDRSLERTTCVLFKRIKK